MVLECLRTLSQLPIHVRKIGFFAINQPPKVDLVDCNMSFLHVSLNISSMNVECLDDMSSYGGLQGLGFEIGTNE